jgi:protein-tyrosine-phosphatase
MKLLFVCTGNTCRSPMAEAIARRLAAERGIDVEVGSAGTSAWDGSPASDGSLLVGIERDFDLNAHRSRQLTREMVEESDLIIAMGPHHLERIEALGGAGKAFLLSTYASHGESTRPVSDPMGGDLSIYRTTADELERDIRRVLDRIAAQRSSGPT